MESRRYTESVVQLMMSLAINYYIHCNISHKTFTIFRRYKYMLGTETYFSILKPYISPKDLHYKQCSPDKTFSFGFNLTVCFNIQFDIKNFRIFDS